MESNLTLIERESHEVELGSYVTAWLRSVPSTTVPNTAVPKTAVPNTAVPNTRHEM